MSISVINVDLLAPVNVSFTNIAILQLGNTPADLATINLPTFLSNYLITAITIESISAVGTLAAATIDLRTASGGSGTSLLSAPIALTGIIGVNTSQIIPSSSFVSTVQTSKTLTLRQTVAALNTGAISGFITVQPLP